MTEARALNSADLLGADLHFEHASVSHPAPDALVEPVRPAPLRYRNLPGVEVAAVCLAVLTVGLVMSAPLGLIAAVLAMSLVVNYHAGRETVRPGLPHIGRILRDTALPIAIVSVGVSLGFVQTQLLADSLLMVAAASGVGVAASLIRRVIAGQVRLVVVGDQMAIADAATRWANEPRVKVVGALLLEPESTQMLASPETFGVQSITGIDEVGSWVATWGADMVVVAPGPGITSVQVRQLSWQLEGTGAALGVLGVLDAVAPHRIDSTHFAGTTLIHVRSSRPSGFIRTVKHMGDRLLGSVLLLLVSPILAMLAIAVRLDTKGPGIFTQTRVGIDGKLFTMYKMRTMQINAEEIKAELAEHDEGNGVLFKMRRDPRITRVGSLLRKTSLDELPQLINVVKGQMSLIGPRPALPEEVAMYNEKERRRLAVRPGITGLWQVSGRSDLDWDTSVDLDLRYADNWRLTDDAVIGLRTVGAVLRSKGAY